jgi:hypothetical protein
MSRVWGREKACKGFGGDVKERENVEDLGIDGMIILKLILNMTGVWTGLTYPVTGANSGGLVSPVTNL